MKGRSLLTCAATGISLFTMMVTPPVMKAAPPNQSTNHVASATFGSSTKLTLVNLPSCHDYLNYKGTLYYNHNYIADSSKLTIPNYADGKIYYWKSPFEKAPSPHGPWRYNPIQVTIAYTRNIQPEGFNYGNSKTQTKWVVNTAFHARADYGTYTLDWRLLSTSHETTHSPATAHVRFTVNHKVFDVYLFKPRHRFEWVIYKVVAE